MPRTRDSKDTLGNVESLPRFTERLVTRVLYLLSAWLLLAFVSGYIISDVYNHFEQMTWRTHKTLESTPVNGQSWIWWRTRKGDACATLMIQKRGKPFKDEYPSAVFQVWVAKDPQGIKSFASQWSAERYAKGFCR